MEAVDGGRGLQMQEALKRARELARAGSYGEAAEIFERVLDENDDAGLRPRLELGFARLLSGDLPGARAVRDRLSAVLDEGTRLSDELRPLWERFCELLEGVARRVVVGSVAAAMIAGCAPSGEPAGKAKGPATISQPAGEATEASQEESAESTKPATAALDLPGPRKPRPGFSAHRYSAGVRIDLDLRPQADPKPTPPKPHPDLDALNGPKRPKPGFSAHRYSAGVRIDPSAFGVKKSDRD